MTLVMSTLFETKTYINIFTKGKVREEDINFESDRTSSKTEKI